MKLGKKIAQSIRATNGTPKTEYVCSATTHFPAMARSMTKKRLKVPALNVTIWILMFLGYVLILFLYPLN
jgi:hypothetical protein